MNKDKLYESVGNYTKFKLVEMLIEKHQDRFKDFSNIEKLADDTELNALGREELIKAEHEFEFSVGYVMGLRKAIELMSKEKITKEMIENWLGTDTDIPELLAELANGDYKAEEFKQDVIDTWQEENEDE